MTLMRVFLGWWVVAGLTMVPTLVDAQAGASGAVAKPVAKPVKPVAKQSAAARSDSAKMQALLTAELRRYEGQLSAMRTEILERAGWAEMGDRCNPGALRVFPHDTTPEQRKATEAIVLRLENRVIVQGAGASLGGADTRALLRTIVGWEAGIDRPRWDDDAGQARLAFATGLTGEVPDPTGPGCLPSPVMADTVSFVIPGFSGMEFPKAPRPRVRAFFGPSGEQHVRNEFFTNVGSRDRQAELAYIRIGPIAHWRGWAVVGVDRPKERGGFALGSGSNGGAVYLLRRVAGEWRLLAIVRSWG